MRIGWLLLAVLLATLSAFSVLHWPRSPLWTRAIPDINSLLHYSKDGASLVVAEGLAENRPVVPHAAVIFYNVQSGQETKRIPISVPNKTFIHNFYISADVDLLIIVSSTAVDRTSSTGEWTLSAFDLRTGKRIYGPVPVSQFHNLAASTDGKWFCYVSNDNNKSKFNVVSRSDLQIRHSIPSLPTATTSAISFLRDETKLLILGSTWTGMPWWQFMSTYPVWLPATVEHLQVFDLATGEEMGRKVLPASCRWFKIVKCTDERIFIEGARLARTSANPVGGDSTREISMVSYDGSGFGEVSIDPALFSQYRQGDHEHRECVAFGDKWMAHSFVQWHDPEKTWWKDGLEWFDQHLGTTILKIFDSKWSVSVTDRGTGATKVTVPTESVPIILASDDGHYLAVTVYDKPGLQLWDADPSPRWPWALGTGVGSLALVLLLPKLKRRKTV